MKRKSILFSISLVLIVLNQTANAIETIQLKHRPAIEIIPTIRPLLKKSDAITGQDYKLFIRTDQKTFNNILPIIEELDKKPISLMITIKTSSQSESNSKNITLNTNPDTSLSVTNHKSYSTRSHHPKIRTLEGTRTFIYTGKVIARPTRQISRQNDQLIEQRLSPYQQTRSGFYATPRITSNNEIIIEIAPQQQSLALDGSHNQFSMSTTIKGKLGEWIALGNIDKLNNNQNTTIDISKKNAERSIQTNSRDTIFVKVERLD